jgi:hypothetical protein
MRTILRYVDGRPEWSENIPSRARIPWFIAGSVSGSAAIPGPGKVVDRSEAVRRGWETRRLRGEGTR